MSSSSTTAVRSPRRTPDPQPARAYAAEVSELVVAAWRDRTLDTLGHDPRSWYVENFWLPAIGPTGILLLRHLADRFDSAPESTFVLPIVETSATLGLGPRQGSSTPLVRTFVRLELFDLCRHLGDGFVEVRRSLPPVNPKHIRRLPEQIRVRHAQWVRRQLDTPPHEIARQRAHRIALTLMEQGDDRDRVERALLDVGFHPALAREAAQWALGRHHEALAAIEQTAPGT